MKPKRQNPFVLAALSLATLAFTVTNSRAVDYYWDSDGTTPGFGSTTGTWGTSAFWSTSSLGTAATANTTITTSDTVNIGTAAANYANGTIGAGTVSVNKIVFGAGQTTAVTLGTSTNTMTFGGTSPTITVDGSGSHTISSIMAGTAGIIKDGTGTLLMSGANTYTGGLVIKNGTVNAAANAATVGGATNTISMGGAGSTGATLIGNTTINRALTINTPTSGAITLAPNTLGNSLTYSGAISLSSGATLSVRSFFANTNVGTGTTTISGGVTGTGSLILENSGTGVGVTGATSQIVVSGTAINHTGSVLARGDNTGAALTTVSAVIGSNVTTFTKEGVVPVTLSGANTYTGKTTVSAGTLSFNTIGNVGAASSALGAPTTVANGTIDLAGSLTYTGAAASSNRVINLTSSGATNTITNSGTGLLTLTGGFTGNSSNIFFRGTQPITVSGLIPATHTGQVSRTDASTLTLSNASNAFTGALTVSNGTISANSIANSGVASAIGAGTQITLGQSGFNNTGTFQFTGASGGSSNRAIDIQSNTGNTNGGIIENTVSGQTLTLSGGVTVGGSGTTPSLQLIGAGNGAMSGIIAGTGLTLAKSGAGSWTLSGVNTYTGTTTVSAGVLRATTSVSALGAGSLTISGGTLQLANDTALNFGRNTTISGTSTITSDRLSAGAGVTHTLGTLSIGAFTLNVSPGANTTSGTGGITFGATTLTGAANFAPATNSQLTVAAVTMGANVLTKSGAGSLTATGVVTGSTAAGTTAVSVTNGLLTLSGANTFTGNIAASSSSSVFAMPGATYTTTAPYGAAGNLYKQVLLTNGGTFRLTSGTFNDNTPSATNVAGGIIFNIGTGGGTFDVASGATLIIDDGTGTGTASTASQLQGAGNLTKTGLGIFQFDDSTAYAGTITVSAGLLQPASGNAFGASSAATIIQSGAALNVNGITMTNAEPLTVNGTGLAATPAGALTCATGNGTWAGPITLGSNATIGGGAGNLTVASTIDLGSNTLTLNQVGVNTLTNGVISGTGGVVVTGSGASGAASLSGANTFTGGVSLNSGSFAVGSSSTGTAGNPTNGPFGAGTTPAVFNGAQVRCGTGGPFSVGNVVSLAANTTFFTVASEKTLTFTGPATLTGNRTLTSTVGNTVAGTSVVFNGVIDDGGNGYGLVKAGTGYLTLGAANTYTGGTTVNEGTLILTGSIPSSTSLTVSPTTASGASFSLASGAANPLGNVSALTLGSGSGPSTIGFDLGTDTASSDSITTPNSATTTGTVNVGITAIAGFGSSSSYTLITAPSGLSGATYALTNAPGGYFYNLTNTDSVVQLAVSAASTGNLFWRGNTNSSWSGISGSNTNWFSDAAGTTNAQSNPGAGNTVNFSTVNATNSVGVINTTLDNNYTVKNIVFGSDPNGVTSVTIAPGLTPAGAPGILSIAPTSSSDGLNVGSNAGSVTISAPVILGATQTWSVNGTGANGSSLTVSGAISGSNTLVINGLVTLSAAATTSTYSGATAVPNGAILQGGATNSFSASSAVTVSGTGILRLNGFSNTILSLSGDGTVQNNHASTAATLTAGDASDQTFSGILQNGGVGTLALNKTGAGILTLSGTNTYTGGTTITAGMIRQGGSGALSGGGALTVNGTSVFDLNGFNASVSTLGGVVTGTVTDNAAGSGTTTLSITNAGSSAAAITNGATRNLALRVTNTNGGFLLTNGGNTFSGGIVLTNSAGGTRMAPGTITSGAYGTGAITIGESATDQAGIYFATGGQTLPNSIIFNTALGTDRVGIRTDAAGITLSGVITANLAPATFTANTATAGSFTLTNQVTGASGLVLDITSLSASATQFSVALNNTSGTNNYQGDTVVNFNAASGKSATLQLLQPDQIPNGAGTGNVYVNSNGTGIGLLSLAGGSETINGLNGSGNVASTSGTVTLTLGDNNASGSHSGSINNTSGTLSVTKIGSGTQTLSGTSNFLGDLTVNGGIVAFPSSPAISGPLGNSTFVNLNGGGISYTSAGTNALNRNLVIGTSAGTVDASNSTGVLTVASITSSGGNLIKTGAGTVALSGTTTLNGGAAGVAINAGTLQAGFGTAGVATISVGATGNLDQTNAATEALTLVNSTGALTLANGAKLGFELNGASYDSIAVASGGTAVTSGVVTLNFTGTPTAGTYNLLSAPSGLSGATYALGSAPNGFNYTINATDTLVSVTITNYTPIFWRGGQDLSWNTLGAGPANWTTDSAGAVDAGSKPVSTDTVIFSATGAPSGTVNTTLDAAVTIDSLQFNNVPGSTNVTIAAGTGGSLTLSPVSTSGGIRVLSGGGNPTISAPLTVGTTQTWDVDPTGSLSISGNTTFTGAVNKTNTGALTLSGTNTGSGAFTLAGGTLNLNSNSALGSGLFTIGAGTTLNTPSGPIGLTNNNVQVWNGDYTFTGANNLNLGTGAVTMSNSVALTTTASTLTIGGNIGDGGSNRNLTKAGAGNLVLSGANSYGGLTSVTGGVLRITSATGLGSTAAGTVLAANTTLELDGTGGAFTVGAESLTINGGGVTVPTPNLGALRNIAGNNTYGGTVTMGIQSRINSDSGTLTLSNPTSVSATNLTLVVGGAGNLTISGAVALGTGGVAKGDAGTLTLSGTNTYSGATAVSGGTFTVDATGSVTTASNVIFSVTGATTIANIAGTYTSTGGGGLAVNSGGILNTSGTVSFSGANNQALFLGTAGGTGTWNVTGGSVSVNYASNGWGIGNGGVGTLSVSAGSVTTAGTNVFNLGHAASGTGNLNISGTGTVTISPGTGAFTLGTTSTSIASVNLDGGTFVLGRNITKNATAVGTFNFNGGLLKAGLTSTTYFPALALTTANVRDGGAKIDTNGFDITVGQALIHSALGGDAATDGGLTKSGTGILTLTGANTYTGATQVNGGTLQLNTSAATGTLTTSGVTVGAGGTLGFTGGSTSTLDLTGKPLTLSGGTLGFDVGSGLSDAITVQDFTLTANSAFTFDAVGAVSNGSTYTVLNSVNDITNSGPYTISGQTLGRVVLTPTINAKTITVAASLFEGTWNQTGGGNWSNGNPAATAGNWNNYKPTVSGDAALFGSAISAPSNVVVDTPHTLAYLRFDNANAYTIGTNGSNNITLNNGADSAAIAVTSGSHVIAENLALLSNLGVQPATGTSLTISGNISGTGKSLQLSDAGTLVLSGAANSYTGATTVSAGTLSLTGSLTGGGGVTVSGTGAISQSSTSVISGASAFTHSSSATSTLDGVNTYTGATTVSAGTLILSGNRTAAATGGFSVGTVTGSTGTLNVTNGTFTVGTTGSTFLVGNGTDSVGIMNQSGGSLTTTGNQLLVGNGASNGTYNLSGGTLTTVAGSLGVTVGTNTGATAAFNLSGTGTLNMPATSTLQICRSDNNVASSITGTFSQTAGAATVGILQMGGSSTTPANNANAIATLSLTGGTFSAATFNMLSGGNNSTSAITIGGSAQVTLPVFPTNVKGSGATATITFDSTTGYLAPVATSTTYMPAGTFNNAYLTANGAKFNVDTGKDITIAQVFGDATAPAAVGTLSKSGTGRLVLGGANTYTGATNINAGSIQITNASGLGSAAGNTVVASGGELVVNTTGLTVAEPFTIAGLGNAGTTGALHTGGSATVGFTGPITLSANSGFQGDGGTNNTISGGIDTAGYSMTFNNAGNVTVSGTGISGSGGSLIKNGGSTLTLSAASTFTGGTTHNGGIITANNNSALGSGSLVIGGGGPTGGAVRLNLGSGVNLANAITINANSGASGTALILVTAGTGTLSGPITINSGTPAGGLLGSTGTGILDIQGVITSSVTVTQRLGTVKYSGGGTGYTSMITTGTTIVGTSNGIATTAAIALGGSGTSTLDLNGFNQSLNGVTKFSPANAAIIGNSSTTADSVLTTTGTSSYDGTIVDSVSGGTRKVSLTVASGQLTLNGVNTYSGATTVNGGSLILGNASALGTSAATVNGGSLNLNGQAITNAVSVGASGTLTGSGSTGAATLAGSVTPGGTSNGLITMASATVASTSAIALQLPATGTRGVNYDALTVSGALALDGTITVDITGLTPTAGQSFDLIDSTGPIDVTNFNVATDLVLPALGGGLAWNTSAFATTGVVSIVSGDPYIGWAASKGLDDSDAAHASAKSADPDGDGHNNLYEFAFDGNPLSAANDGKIVGKIATIGADQVMTLTVPVRTGAIFSASSGDQVSALIDALYYRIEGDVDLGTFANTISEVTGGAETAIQAGLPTLSSGWTYRTFRDAGTVPTVPKAFLRAKISDTP